MHTHEEVKLSCLLIYLLSNFIPQIQHYTEHNINVKV